MHHFDDKIFLSIDFSNKFIEKCQYLKICFRSLTYNHHMSQDYATEVLLEPIIWIVDNYSGSLGPVSRFPVQSPVAKINNNTKLIYNIIDYKNT